MRVSVVLCTYNGEKYVAEQLRSIFSQTDKPDEIMVCDDCSTDNTVQILNSVFSEWDGKYSIVVNEKNLGYKKNFQKGIDLCTGDLIFLCDQDDIWKEDKIFKLKAVFENDDIILAFHDSTVVDQNLNIIDKSFWGILDFDISKFQNNNYDRLLFTNVIQGSACAFKKILYIQARPFPEEAIHDEWLGLFAAVVGKIAVVQEQLMLYRQTGSNQIGASKITVSEKIRKWIFKVNHSSDEYVRSIRRRIVIIKKIYEYRDCFGYGVTDFVLDKNKAILERNILKLFCLVPKYLFYYGKLRSIKYLVKDIVTSICYKEDG